MENDNRTMKSELTNIAHRGARSLAPENTLFAANKAYEVGADMWETDVQFTKDRHLVLVHDETLVRTTDVESVYPDSNSYKVSDFTLDEISRLDAGSWFVNSDPFELLEQCEIPRSGINKFKEVKIPTLKEGLELTKQLDWKVNLEIKPVKRATKRIARRVVGLIEETDMETNTIISSFDHSLVKFAGELNPDIATALLVEELMPDVVRAMRENGAKFFIIAGTALEEDRAKASLRELKTASDKYAVNVFTVNEQDDLEKLMGDPLIDGIITDYPQLLFSLMNPEGGEKN